MTEAAAASAPPERPRRTRAPHLYEIDVLRILTFLCVIGVHVTSHTAGPDDLGLYALLDLLHFTREVFFALTAFVLVYSYNARPQPMRRFWPKRFLLVGVPYVVWSVIYEVLNWLHTPTGSPAALLHSTVIAILTGKAWYHLYFLLVTMQVYLLLPCILWLVRRTRGRHGLLLLGALVVQGGLMTWYYYFPGSTGWYGHWATQLVFTYTFFIMVGAVAADHAQAFLPWVRGHRRLIAGMAVGAGLLTLGVFWLNDALKHTTVSNATNAMQPMMIFWGVFIGLAFLAIGTRWADRRRAASLSARFVDTASDRSFGIFLAHPLVLWFLLWAGDDWFTRVIPTPWLTFVMYPLVVLGAVLITEVARRTPVSLALTGRRFVSRTKRAAAARG